jgi:hypothetical protein
MQNNPSNDSGNKDAPNTDVDAATTTTTTTTKSTTGTNFTLPQEIPKLPSLRESIQEFVVKTNQALSSLELKYRDSIQKPASQAIHQLSDTSTTINEQAKRLYQEHLQYEPYAMIGATLLVGGLTTVRRGRVAGICSTVVFGGLSYWIVYGLDDEISPIARQNNSLDWSKIIPTSITDLWKSK